VQRRQVHVSVARAYPLPVVGTVPLQECFAPQRSSCSEAPFQADDEHSRIWQPPIGADEVMAGIEGEDTLGEEKPVETAPDEDEGMVL
jgi:hypothetical protein